MSKSRVDLRKLQAEIRELRKRVAVLEASLVLLLPPAVHKGKWVG